MTEAEKVPSSVVSALLVSNDFPPVHGGIQRYMSAVASELQRDGFAVSVIAPERPGAREFDAETPYRVFRYKGRGLVRHFVGMWLTLIRLQFREATPRFTLASLWFPAGLAALLLPRTLRGRVVVLVHGAELKPSQFGIRRRLMRFVLQRADTVVANSTFTAELVRKCDIERNVHVVHCGVDAFDAVRAPSPQPLILAVGRLVKRKGFDRLLQALPSVFAVLPNARCEIVGDGPMRKTLMMQATSLGIESQISFLGSVGDVELRRAYERAWCFALPVRNDDDDVEGFGIVYLEAAMGSLATIGGLRSGAEDAILDGETGLLVDGNEPEAIAVAIITLLSDPNRAKQMGERGRNRALERFTWHRCMTGLLEAIG